MYVKIQRSKRFNKLKQNKQKKNNKNKANKIYDLQKKQLETCMKSENNWELSLLRSEEEN